MRGTNARKSRCRWWRKWRHLIMFGAAIALILTQFHQVNAHSSRGEREELRVVNDFRQDALVADKIPSASLPTPQIHPLPTPLAQWQDATGTDDYFSQVKPTPLGYLVWSQFPVKVYVEQPTEPSELSAEVRRFQDWVQAVLQAVQEWSVYLPLEVVTQAQGADIAILRSRPPLQATINRETGKIDLPRARSAQTHYKFYLRQVGDVSNLVLAQRFTIQLSPDQSADYTLATARHELGHALGIWGHSPLETDVMYFSQVRNSPHISARDINTLKRIYQQPTRIGWSLPDNGDRLLINEGMNKRSLLPLP